MKNAWIACLVVLVAACGSYHFPPSGTESTGTISGGVISVPCGPIEPADIDCKGRPVSGLEIDYLSGQDIKARTVTDSNGDYSIEIAAGTYRVRLKSYMRILSGPTTVTVTPGSRVVANYVLDSGIRAPVPQQ